MDRKKQKINFILQLLIVSLFISGSLVFFYPFIADAVNNYHDQKMVEKIEREARADFKQEKKERYAAMLKKNEAAKKDKEGTIGLTEDLFEYDENSRMTLSKTEFKQHLIGSVYIPKLNVGLPLFDETNDTLLEAGATVLQGTSFPTGGKDTHSVITGHSGLPTKKLFTDLEELVIGDSFIVDNLTEKLQYEVVELKEVLPTETDTLVIKEGQDLVTLLTCTPYMINTHRLLVTGKRVPYEEARLNREIKSIKQGQNKRVYLLITIALSVIVSLTIWIRYKINRHKKILKGV